GLEPPHPCGYMDLNHARLPIPPLRQVSTDRCGHGRLEGRDYGIYSYKARTECQTSGTTECAPKSKHLHWIEKRHKDVGKAFHQAKKRSSKIQSRSPENSHQTAFFGS